MSLLAWSARPSGDGDMWNTRFRELVAFREENGDCLVPRSYAQNQQLSNWVANQRTHYRLYMKAQESGDAGDSEYTFMTPDRIAKLEAIGFAWSLRKRRPKKRAAVDESEDAAMRSQAEEESKDMWEL